jgi:hypothetical protein
MILSRQLNSSNPDEHFELQHRAEESTSEPIISSCHTLIRLQFSAIQDTSYSDEVHNVSFVLRALNIGLYLRYIVIPSLLV